MEIKKLLDVIQVQRHDFLNHLQVISGLSQLNKLDRIREYVVQVSLEITRMSLTTRVRVPEVTAALLTGFYDAAQYQIQFDLTVDSGLEHLAVPGPVAGDALESIFHCVTQALAGPEIPARRLGVAFSENGRYYSCQFELPEVPPAGKPLLEQGPLAAGRLLSPHGGQVNLAEKEKGVQINLMLPRKEVKTG